MKKIYGLLILAATLSACHHVYYAPNTANVPLLSEKGETRINALYSGGNNSEFTGGELQVAYAVSKNIGVMINGFAAGKTEEVSNLSSSAHIENGNGAYIEFAGGYFKALDDKKKWITEVYGGLGFGSVKNEYGFADHSKTNINKFFLQPSIGYKAGHFEFAIAPKLSYVTWRIKEAKITSRENVDEKNDVDAIKSNPSFFAFEPALLLRAGGKGFKIQLGWSFSHSMSSSFTKELIELETANIGISINLKPPKR